jgi:hypothetical protein
VLASREAGPEASVTSNPPLTCYMAVVPLTAVVVVVNIGHIHAEEGLRLRELRLRAQAETPSAFGSTLAKEQTRQQEDGDHLAAVFQHGFFTCRFSSGNGGVQAGRLRFSQS